MDNSQSSDFLSESTDIFCNSPDADSTIMDTVTYESLVSNTKLAFNNVRKEIGRSAFSEYFSSLLKDCSSCISQSLDLITTLLSQTYININKVIEYMGDAASMLQLLSALIKNIIHTISMSCCSMKTFPTVTGQIVMLVFAHCKDSESVYGNQLQMVEKSIKDLFRSCHELQLTYLMALEKHYVFDLTEHEEIDILIEALGINLKIGEIVQSLDVKTMAEQWKAYTMICEKYSSTLMDKKIYSDCTKILCTMVTNTIKTALEENQEQKVILRCLKVSSFTLKILQRVCIIFKHAVNKDYDSIMELLLFVNLNNEAYLQTIGGKSPQFISLFNSNVLSPLNVLLVELLYDNKMLQCICNYDVHAIRKDDKLLGLVILVISTIRSLLQKGGDQLAKLQKHLLINVIYGFLPLCHIWFNMGLIFRCEVTDGYYQTYGLYEHLLTHTVTLASMMISEEINIMEKRMLEALLGTDCTSAIFTSNLWVLLAGMSSRQLLLAQVVSLSKIYQKLENNILFLDSPQKVNLSHTMGALFEIMANEDKKKIYNMFNISDERNMNLWSCLKIKNLPSEVQCHAEEKTLEQFQTQIQKLASNKNIKIDSVIKLIVMASTCPHTNRDDALEFFVIEAWGKACLNKLKLTMKMLHQGTLWFYKYIEALVALTESVEHIFDGNSVHVVKVLHIIFNVVQEGCTELNLLLIDILCKLANFVPNDMNKHTADTILTQTFGALFENTECIVKNKLYNTLRQYENNSLHRIVYHAINKDESLKEAWTYFIKHGKVMKNGNTTLKKQLEYTMDFKYCHKCIEQGDDFRDSGSVCLQHTLSNNFDLIDIDSLFEPESDAEPACKKAKLNINELEGIVRRLETDASLLCSVKENIFTSEYKNRIKIVCNKLNNIID
ncbi:unnamed protein product [Arctia plantaginis]|uniref:Uncharacterized protein n=1 Tax=Arctia plantaginis TaxID=874455 RepID=A0A8S0ZLJ6_ARCPL|nr:unnamed protein product [Arctia plantaginis]